jgi:hypothetical protein
MVELLVIAGGLVVAAVALTFALQRREERLERDRLDRLRRALQSPLEGPWTR